jgi:predicted transcriptional regulator
MNSLINIPIKTEKKCKKCGQVKPLGSFNITHRKTSYRTECKNCQSIDNKLNYKKLPKSLLFKKQACERAAKWRKENSKRNKLSNAAYRKKNPTKTTTWRKSHLIEVNEYNRKMGRIRRLQIKNKLNKSISSNMLHSLKNGSKNNRHWELLVCYNLEQLKNHLEKQFQPGMSWDNYGKWHIDHKIPISAFNYTTPEDIDFKRCWALSNLQPMWAIENIKKGNKLTAPFQPSLAIAV